MNATRTVWVGLLAPFMLVGCLVVPGYQNEGVVVVPALPALVVLGPEPYYVQGGYHYHYRNNGWYYSRSRSGPWVDLPRDRYPREVRFKDKDGGAKRDGGRNPGHQGR